MTEQWLPVVGFDGYEVSDRGNVRSLACPLGLKLLCHPRQDYRRVALRGQFRLVHRLVLEAFIGPCPIGQQARHLNDIGNDNRLENLAWGTQEDNKSDASKNGNMRRGHRARHNVVDTDAVRADYAAGVSLKQLARKHKTSFELLRDIVTDRPRVPYFLQSRAEG